LELGGFGLFVDDGGLDVCEAGVLEHGFEVGLGEAKPLVGVEFAGFFEAVLDEVEDDDAAAGLEDAMGFGEGAGGVQGVVEGLRKEGEIDGGRVDGDLFHVAEAVFDVLDAGAESLFAGNFEHVGGGVDCYHAHGTLRE